MHIFHKHSLTHLHAVDSVPLCNTAMIKIVMSRQPQARVIKVPEEDYFVQAIRIALRARDTPHAVVLQPLPKEHVAVLKIAARRGVNSMASWEL